MHTYLYINIFLIMRGRTQGGISMRDDVVRLSFDISVHEHAGKLTQNV